jgi:hypothetical protein
MPQHKWTKSLNRGGTVRPTLTKTITAEEELAIEITVPVSTTDQQILIAFTMANLKSLFISASGPLTLKTNSTGAPDDTFALDDDSGVDWDNQSLLDNPITANVTTMYVTNASGVNTADLKIYVLLDPTV